MLFWLYYFLIDFNGSLNKKHIDICHDRIMLDISNKYSTSWQCEKIVKFGSKKRFFFFTIFSQSPRKTHKIRANQKFCEKL